MLIFFAIPCPGYFGNMAESVSLHDVFGSAKRTLSFIEGPFGDEQAFKQASGIWCANTASTTCMMPGQKAEFYSQVFPFGLNGHRSVSHHGEPQHENIITSA